MKFAEAINKALLEIMSADDRTILLGEDVGKFGGRFEAINEELFIGIALGASAGGLKPIIEIYYNEFLNIAFDDLWRAGLWQKLYKNKVQSSIIIRCVFGGYVRRGPEFSSAAVGHLISIPNIKIYAPSNVSDGYWILKEAIRQPGIKLILEHKALYRTSGIIDTEGGRSLVGGEIKRKGSNLTIVAYSYLVGSALRAAEILFDSYGIDSEIIDLKVIWPLDFQLILGSVRKTKKVVLVEECTRNAGVLVHIENELLKNIPRLNIENVTAKNDLIPFGEEETAVLPSIIDIVEAGERLCVRNKLLQR